MPDRERADEIENVATAWAARAERGLTAGERAELECWLEGDRRRLGAFVRAQAAWIHAERAAALGGMPAAEPLAHSPEMSAPPLVPHRLNRRMILGGGAAIAASATAAIFLALPRYAILESGVGEIRHITLPGGTVLVLDTDTRVDIGTAADKQRLELKRGKLFLDVARAAGSPLVVTAERLMLETVTGAFALQALADSPIVALVTRGHLIASQGGGLFGRRHSLVVAQGHELRLATGATLVPSDIHPVTPARNEQFLAWRDGLLVFGGEALGEAVRAFDRYGTVRIVVADPELAQQKITGLFKADDPRGFASAIAASFGGSVSSQGDVLRISQKKSVGL